MDRTTAEELERLHSDGLPPEALVEVTHMFGDSTLTFAERTDFWDALRDSGFGIPGESGSVDADEEASGSEHWHHWATTPLSASPDVLIRADNLAREIADRHGVRYNGWLVQRDQQTKQPRIVAPTRGREWIFEDNLRPFLRFAAEQVEYDFDDLDWEAVALEA